MPKLHCFRNKCLNGDGKYSEIVCAYSAEDAAKVLKKHIADFGDAELSFEFEQIDDSEMIAVHTDDGRGEVNQPAHEWTKEINRGVVSSLYFY